ncbi:hypothetical protein HDU97_000129 [Phlyctochytrium planicorne]|nr:hypothetical protein HDU97_000129 [Phlyctochytrium planicorne]
MHDETAADVTVVVGDDRVEFKSHRIMLMARSEYFRRLFGSNSTVDHVSLLHLDPDAFRIVRRFLYTAEEEDEATSPTTDDWRLVLEAYRITEFLGVHERSPAYHDCFVSIFRRFALDTPDRETCRDMWIQTQHHNLDNLLVGCAPYFWMMFGTGSNSNAASRSGEEDLRELLGGRLETLVRVVNAVPAGLETPVGRFRLVRSWVLGRQGGAGQLQQQGQGQKGSLLRKGWGPEDEEEREEGFGGSTPTERYRGGSGYYEEEEDEEEFEDDRDEFGYENGNGNGNGEDDEEEEDSFSSSPTTTAENPSSATSPNQPGLGGVEDSPGRKRESYMSTSTVTTYASSTPSRVPSSYGGGRYASLKRQTSVDFSGDQQQTVQVQHQQVRRRNTNASLREEEGRQRRSRPASMIVTNGGGVGGKGPRSARGVVGGFQYTGFMRSMRATGASGGGGEERKSVGGGGAGVNATTGGAAAGAGGVAVVERRRKPLSTAKILANLDLTGITALDLADEVEPSGLLSDRHLLTLYRAAALDAATGGKDGNSSALVWAPLPCGLNGRRFLTPNPKAGQGAVSISAGQRPDAVAILENYGLLSPGNAGGNASHGAGAAVNALSALSVTYCGLEPLRSGVWSWTVVVTARERVVGIGVSADLGGGGVGGAGAGEFVVGQKGLVSRLSFLGAALGSVGEVFKGAFGGGNGVGGGRQFEQHLQHQQYQQQQQQQQQFYPPPPPQSSASPPPPHLGGLGLSNGGGSGRSTPEFVEYNGSNSSHAGAPTPPPFFQSAASSLAHLAAGHRGSIGGAWMDAAPPSPPALDDGEVFGVREGMVSPPNMNNGAVPPFPLRPPSSLGNLAADEVYERNGNTTRQQHLLGQNPTIPPFPAPHVGGGGDVPPLPEFATRHYPNATPVLGALPVGSGGGGGGVVGAPPKFVGEDGGWSVWSDGSLRVGKIFVGRLPRGVSFGRGTEVVVKLDMDRRTLGFEVGGVDCGVAFRGLPGVVYPSVCLGDGGGVSVGKVSRIA